MHRITALAGDHQHESGPFGLGLLEKPPKRGMCLRLSHAMQIDARVDRVVAAGELLPRTPIERRQRGSGVVRYRARLRRSRKWTAGIRARALFFGGEVVSRACPANWRHGTCYATPQVPLFIAQSPTALALILGCTHRVRQRDCGRTAGRGFGAAAWGVTFVGLTLSVAGTSGRGVGSGIAAPATAGS